MNIDEFDTDLESNEYTLFLPAGKFIPSTQRSFGSIYMLDAAVDGVRVHADGVNGLTLHKAQTLKHPLKNVRFVSDIDQTIRYQVNVDVTRGFADRTIDIDNATVQRLANSDIADFGPVATDKLREDKSLSVDTILAIGNAVEGAVLSATQSIPEIADFGADATNKLREAKRLTAQSVAEIGDAVEAGVSAALQSADFQSALQQSFENALATLLDNDGNVKTKEAL